MQMNEILPKPKFQVGQRVYVMANYTKAVLTDRIYIIVQITLACMSVLSFPEEKDEPYDYMLVNEKNIGIPGSGKDIVWNTRESFIVGVE